MDSQAYRDVLLRLSALERRVNAVFRVGVAAEVTLDPYRVRLDIGPDEDGGPVLTDPLPVLVPAAGIVRVWSPVTVGERCGLLSPGGEDFSAFVMPALYSADFAPPDDEGERCVIALGSAGARAVLTSDGTIRLEARTSTIEMTPAGCTITAPDIALVGNVAASGGTLEHKGTDVGDSHAHRGVAAGLATTGPPV